MNSGFLRGSPNIGLPTPMTPLEFLNSTKVSSEDKELFLEAYKAQLREQNDEAIKLYNTLLGKYLGNKVIQHNLSLIKGKSI